MNNEQHHHEQRNCKNENDQTRNGVQVTKRERDPENGERKFHPNVNEPERGCEPTLLGPNVGGVAPTCGTTVDHLTEGPNEI